MRKTLLFIAILVTTASNAQVKDNGAIVTAETVKSVKNLLLTPAKPTPGSVITVRYNPTNTSLVGLKDFDATAYLLEGDLPVAVEIPLKEENGIYQGNFQTTANTRAVFICFSKDETLPNRVVDNNDDKGYFTAMYQPDGKMVIGANNALSTGFNKYYSIWKMKSNADIAKDFNKAEFAARVSRSKFYGEYLRFLAQSGDPDNLKILHKEVDRFLQRKNVTESDLTNVKDIYEVILNDKSKADAIYALMKKKFPLGKWVLFEYEGQDLEKKILTFQKVLAAYQGKKEYRDLIHIMAAMIAQTYAIERKFDKMDPYIKYFKDKTNLAAFYNTYAGQLSGGSVASTPIDVKKGLEFSNIALACLKEEIDNPQARPVYLTPKQYLKKQNMALNSYLQIKAILLYHNNQSGEAYTLLKQTMNGANTNVYMNANYALVTEKVKGEGEAQRLLEDYVVIGKANQQMKSQLKRIYLKSHTPEEFTQYLKGLEKASFNKLKEDLAKQMIANAAPDFSLKNMAGETVSLASLKGKVVVVDFWSTWCGPCKASFPTMQVLVEKYKSNPGVVFLFIDTWESGDERKGEVEAFIKKNKYDFNVLYDEVRQGSKSDFVVVSDFNVSGIPTKFVIDKKGYVRFRSSGYDGSSDKLINELDAMIEMAGLVEGSSMAK